jgi:hypothetical protein
METDYTKKWQDNCRRLEDNSAKSLAYFKYILSKMDNIYLYEEHLNKIVDLMLKSEEMFQNSLDEIGEIGEFILNNQTSIKKVYDSAIAREIRINKILE